MVRLVTLHLLNPDPVIDYMLLKPPAVALLDQLFVQGGDLCISDVSLADLYSGPHDRDRPRTDRLLRRLGYLQTSYDAAVRPASGVINTAGLVSNSL